MAWIHLWLTPRQLSVIGLRMSKELAVTRYYACFLVCLGINWTSETSVSLPNTKGSIRPSDWLYPFCFFLLSPNNLALFNQRKPYFQTRISIQTDLFHLRLWHQSLSCHTWVFLYLTAEILEIVELACRKISWINTKRYSKFDALGSGSSLKGNLSRTHFTSSIFQ